MNVNFLNAGHRLVIQFLLVLLFLVSSEAVSIGQQVTTLADNVAGSLRFAIRDAQPGATITFAPSLQNGTIRLNGTDLLINKNITIDGTGRNITIDADEKSRVFQINAGTTTLVGLTITGGNTDNGGGIRINNTSGILEVWNCVIAGNTATGSGGGIFNWGGTLTVINSTITGNSANTGGGIRNNGTAILYNTIVAGNSSDISVLNTATLSGSNNLIGNGAGQTTLVSRENGNIVGTTFRPVDPMFV
ncbi:MAG: hypothetical protein FWE95_02265, partial [Planctomycetaceae bacterium]|nr:hypothetical protein [Planctomycetaceae bacterium]